MRSSAESSGGPRTHATRCWWCGAEVYYHTNGYGDSVLFDALGWPWEVHACWEEYRRTLERGPSTSGTPAGNRYSVPTDAALPLTRAVPPSSGHQHPVTLVGYVARNHILWPLPSVVRLHSGDLHHVARWFRIDIAGGGISYPFQVPEEIADHIKEHTLVQAAGQWLRWEGRWFLIATRFVVTTYPDGKQTILHIMDLPDVARCHHCGVSIAHSVWEIDAFRKVACKACAARSTHVGSKHDDQRPSIGAPWRTGHMECSSDIGYYIRDDRDGARYPCRAIDTKPVSSFNRLKKQVRAGMAPRVRFQVTVRIGRAVVSRMEVLS